MAIFTKRVYSWRSFTTRAELWAMDSLSARVSAKLAELAERRGFRSRLAEAVKLKPPAITLYARGEREVTLEMLEAMSDLSGIPLAELVVPPGAVVKQLDADEAALLRYARSWPKSVLHGLLNFLHYWADEPPVVEQTRKLHEYWRVMPVKNKDAFFGLASFLSERTLEPDLLEGLEAHVKAERYTRQADDAKKRRSKQP